MYSHYYTKQGKPGKLLIANVKPVIAKPSVIAEQIPEEQKRVQQGSLIRVGLKHIKSFREWLISEGFKCSDIKPAKFDEVVFSVYKCGAYRQVWNHNQNYYKLGSGIAELWKQYVKSISSG